MFTVHSNCSISGVLSKISVMSLDKGLQYVKIKIHILDQFHCLHDPSLIMIFPFSLSYGKGK